MRRSGNKAGALQGLDRAQVCPQPCPAISQASKRAKPGATVAVRPVSSRSSSASGGALKSPQTTVGNVAVATSSTKATSWRTEACRVALAGGGQSRATEKADRLPRGPAMRAKRAEPPQVSGPGAWKSRNSRPSMGQRESTPDPVAQSSAKKVPPPDAA